jgi:hypothetical protein
VPGAIFTVIGLLVVGSSIASLVLTFAGLYAAGYLYLYRIILVERVVLHFDGISVHRLGRPKTMHFDSVDEVWFECQIAPATLSGLVLVDHAGRRVRFSVLVADAAALVDAVVERCSAPLLPEAIEALERGDSLHFGPRVEISRASFSFRGSVRRWEEIEEVGFEAGAIHFYVEGRRLWAAVGLTDVPHPRVFLELVRRVAPVPGGR